MSMLPLSIPNFRIADRCFYCKHCAVENVKRVPYCKKYDVYFSEGEALARICNSFVHWKKEG